MIPFRPRRRCGRLLDLDAVAARCTIRSRAYRGLRPIPIVAVAGTLDRCCDFDRCFNPLRPHLRRAVSNVRRAFPDGAVPPVDVVQFGDEYFVSDGHKRIGAARAAGADYVDAAITELVAGPCRAGG